MMSNLISGRNRKMWDADPLNAVEFEISYLTASCGTRYLTFKEKQKMRDLTVLKKELEEKNENLSLSNKSI